MVTAVDHENYASEEIRPILRRLRQYVRSLASVRETITPEQRFVYQVGLNEQFLEIKVQKRAVVIRFKRTILSDPKGVVREIAKSKGWTSENEIYVHDTAELEYAIPFIVAAYEKGS